MILIQFIVYFIYISMETQLYLKFHNIVKCRTDQICLIVSLTNITSKESLYLNKSLQVLYLGIMPNISGTKEKMILISMQRNINGFPKLDFNYIIKNKDKKTYISCQSTDISLNYELERCNLHTECESKSIDNNIKSFIPLNTIQSMEYKKKSSFICISLKSDENGFDLFCFITANKKQTNENILLKINNHTFTSSIFIQEGDSQGDFMITFHLAKIKLVNLKYEIYTVDFMWRHVKNHGEYLLPPRFVKSDKIRVSEMCKMDTIDSLYLYISCNLFAAIEYKVVLQSEEHKNSKNTTHLNVQIKNTGKDGNVGKITSFDKNSLFGYFEIVVEKIFKNSRIQYLDVLLPQFSAKGPKIKEDQIELHSFQIRDNSLMNFQINYCTSCRKCIFLFKAAEMSLIPSKSNIFRLKELFVFDIKFNLNEKLLLAKFNFFNITVLYWDNSFWKNISFFVNWNRGYSSSKILNILTINQRMANFFKYNILLEILSDVCIETEMKYNVESYRSYDFTNNIKNNQFKTLSQNYDKILDECKNEVTLRTLDKLLTKSNLGSVAGSKKGVDKTNQIGIQTDLLKNVINDQIKKMKMNFLRAKFFLQEVKGENILKFEDFKQRIQKVSNLFSNNVAIANVLTNDDKMNISLKTNKLNDLDPLEIAKFEMLKFENGSMIFQMILCSENSKLKLLNKITFDLQPIHRQIYSTSAYLYMTDNISPDRKSECKFYNSSDQIKKLKCECFSLPCVLVVLYNEIEDPSTNGNIIGLSDVQNSSNISESDEQTLIQSEIGIQKLMPLIPTIISAVLLLKIFISDCLEKRRICYKNSEAIKISCIIICFFKIANIFFEPSNTAEYLILQLLNGFSTFILYLVLFIIGQKIYACFLPKSKLSTLCTTPVIILTCVVGIIWIGLAIVILRNLDLREEMAESISKRIMLLPVFSVEILWAIWVTWKTKLFSDVDSMNKLCNFATIKMCSLMLYLNILIATSWIFQLMGSLYWKFTMLSDFCEGLYGIVIYITLSYKLFIVAPTQFSMIID